MKEQIRLSRQQEGRAHGASQSLSKAVQKDKLKGILETAGQLPTQMMMCEIKMSQEDPEDVTTQLHA